MLTVSCCYLLTTCLCVLTGFLALQTAMAPGSSTSPQRFRHPVIYALWGVVVLGAAAQVAALFMPVHPLTGALLALFLVPAALRQKESLFRYAAAVRQKAREQKALLAAGGLILLCISSQGAGPIIMDDTDSYHLQAIKWIQEYGTVPGLANLHERYGFNSSWFSFAALVIPRGTGLNFYTVANGVLSCWCCFYLFSEAWPGRQTGPEGKSLAYRFACAVLLGVALFCWPMIRGNAATANYDFITTFMIIVLMTGFAARGNLPKQAKSFLPEMILWPVFLCTVRIINFPLLLVSLAALLSLWKTGLRSPLLAALLAAGVLVIPFLIRNVVLSGYLFYPSWQPDLFQPDWKADLGQVKELVRYIKYFNRVNTGMMPLEETARLSFPRWIPVWFHYLFGYDKPVLLAGLAGFSMCLVKRRKFMQLPPAARLLTAACVLQLLTWFWVAPDPRFVYGPLLCGAFLLTWLLLSHRVLQHHARMLTLGLMMMMSAFLLYTLYRAVRMPVYRQWVWPVDLPVPRTRLVSIDGVQLTIPLRMPGNWNARCYGLALPCLYEVSPRLHARGHSIADGFKLSPQPVPIP